jgi:hypothetical protein
MSIETRLANERQDSANSQAVLQGKADSATRQKEQAQAGAGKPLIRFSGTA